MAEAASAGLPGRLRLVVAAEIVVAAAFSALWLLIVDGLGWPRATADRALSAAFIASPVSLAVLAGWLAHRLWRRGRRRGAIACVAIVGTALAALVVGWAGLFA